MNLSNPGKITLDVVAREKSDFAPTNLHIISAALMIPVSCRPMNRKRRAPSMQSGALLCLNVLLVGISTSWLHAFLQTLSLSDR